jgi:8-oxo-dGTP pyrophosphatase MutT (NUDIX family)
VSSICLPQAVLDTASASLSLVPLGVGQRCTIGMSPHTGLPSRWPTTNYSSRAFVLCAGCILFRHVRRSSARTLQVCLLQYGHEWLLAKGRKDQGEELSAAALRETREETGYPCAFLPVALYTRAPPSGADIMDAPGGAATEGCTEPFMVTVRSKATDDVKLIAWYIAEVDDKSAPHDQDGEVRKVEDTQMPSETFISVFLEVEDALARLTFTADKEVLASAVDVV